MPEVNEVKRYADFLRGYLKGKEITEINILKGRYKNKKFKMYDELVKKLPIKVIDILSKGKFLYFILEGGYYIFSTLGLKGGWVEFDGKKYTLCKNSYDAGFEKTYIDHLNVEFKTKENTIYFVDQLSWGTLKVINDVNILNKKLSVLGPDIMDVNTTFDIFKTQITKKVNLNKMIGIVLMNQGIISGIGNYLRADILWMSKVSPFRLIKSLYENDLYDIYENARVLTWCEYDRVKGVELGIIDKECKSPIDYGREFFVYMQEKDIYGNKVITNDLNVGSQKRTIYWVPDIQK